MPELIDVIDANRCFLGKVLERGCALKKGEHFLSVNVWIVNSQKQFLLQKRVATKKVEPNVWSVSGGVVDAGESSLDGCCRETFEEVGVVVDREKAILLKQANEPDAWGAMVDVWLVESDCLIENVLIQKSEVADVKWASLEEIKELIEKKEFSSNVLFALDEVMKACGLN